MFQDVAFALFDVSLICSCKTNSDKCRLDEDYQSIKIFKPPFYIQNSLFVNFSDNLASITPETKNFCHFDFGIIYLGSGNNFFMVENILQSGNLPNYKGDSTKCRLGKCRFGSPFFCRIHEHPIFTLSYILHKHCTSPPGLASFF